VATRGLGLCHRLIGLGTCNRRSHSWNTRLHSDLASIFSEPKGKKMSAELDTSVISMRTDRKFYHEGCGGAIVVNSQGFRCSGVDSLGNKCTFKQDFIHGRVLMAVYIVGD